MKAEARLLRIATVMMLSFPAIPSLAIANIPLLQWTRTFAGRSGTLYIDDALGVAAGQDGSLYLLCNAWDFKAGGIWDLRLNKYSSDGSLIWTMTYDGRQSPFEYGYDLAIDGGGSVYIAGSQDETDFNLLFMKYSSSGAIIWSVTHDSGADILGDDDVGVGIALDKNGYAYITGLINHNISTNMDMSLYKYSPSGTLLWTVSYDGGPSDWGNHVAVSPTGDIYIAGASYNGINNDAILWKYASDGTLLSKAVYDGGGDDDGYGLAIDATGGVYVGINSSKAGVFNTSIRKYASSGIPVWTLTSVGKNNLNSSGGGIVLDDEGGVYVTGGVPGAAGNDLLLAKATSCGQLLWSVTFDAGTSEVGSGVALDGNGNVYVCGNYDYMVGGTRDSLLLKYQIRDTGICIPDPPTGLEAADHCNGVGLGWQKTPSSINGYRIYRSTYAGSGKSFLAAAATSASLFLDEAVTRGTAYWYELSAMSGTLESGFSNEAGAPHAGCDRTIIPPVYQGPVRVFPNPFNPATALRGTFKFEGIPVGKKARIYSARGLKVWEATATGPLLEWDGRNDAGKPVASGVYLWTADENKGTKRGKLVVINR